MLFKDMERLGFLIYLKACKLYLNTDEINELNKLLNEFNEEMKNNA